MSIGLFLLGFFSLIGLVWYHRLPGHLGWLFALGWIAFAEYLCGSLPLFTMLFAIPAAFFVVPTLRRQFLSRRLFDIYKKVLPAMSQTERDAIDAGTVWWDAQLFSGDPDWKKLHQFPQPKLSPEEQDFLQGPAEELCKMANDWNITHERADLSPEVWTFLKEKGFFSLIIKKEYGGLAFSAYAQSLILQKLSGVSNVLSSTVGVPNSLGPGELLQEYGTQEQKNYYLPRLARGEEIPCFALTSPEAGSDAGAIPDIGIVCRGTWQGEDVLGMKLTWNKRYITLAPVATLLGLAFRLYDPQGLLGKEKNIGITCALVPTDTDGVHIGRRHFPLNQPFQNGPTSGTEVFLPLDAIIGGQAMAGQGWRMLTECLSVGRGITLPSNSAGIMKSLCLATGAYSRIRRQFKIPIGYMEGIQEPLARIGGSTYMMDAATRLTVTGLDMGEKPSIISAIVKYHLTDRMQKCVIDAMDIHGGKGICLGPNNYVGRLYQGAPIAVTVEGANILTRCMIIYGQGAMRCHPFVFKEIESVNESSPERALEQFDTAVFGHIAFALSNLTRSVWFALTGGYLISAPKRGTLARYYQICTRFSTYLALLSDVCMGLFGGTLKRKERVTARLGDVLSYLYLSSAVLKRFHDEGECVQDLPLVEWALQDNLYKAQQAIYELLENLAPKALMVVMRRLFFPLGPVVRKPSDKLDAQVSELLVQQTDTRKRLGAGQYWQAVENNPMGMLEQAFQDILRAEPIYERIKENLDKPVGFMQLDELAQIALAQGIISEEEAQILSDAEISRLRTINVDDFDSQTLSAGV